MNIHIYLWIVRWLMVIWLLCTFPIRFFPVSLSVSPVISFHFARHHIVFQFWVLLAVFSAFISMAMPRLGRCSCLLSIIDFHRIWMFSTSVGGIAQFVYALVFLLSYFCFVFIPFQFSFDFCVCRKYVVIFQFYAKKKKESTITRSSLVG